MNIKLGELCKIDNHKTSITTPFFHTNKQSLSLTNYP